ncbi:MAG TPA: 4-oxalocrotonate decarboxylase [Gordonia sp. (in: high G+C Gram-positive bacteria)]|uniref:2-keto-4-pentenoate hydratase n=2 Tax=Gordonia TaxID=2053 RepID=UPI000FB6D89D|nr:MULTISPECIES: fumarylacetoacetate hydrolase family protein [unclassified Gordonia (in: high G+C Gram-positive bacteria)]RUP40026.1 MAG: 4-oxalocrotonate decarboxylase [Gordonia sp. (in: high G+C Gram-positive bacteria)]HNP56599.1 4-oxalocrotonate decarboxylase [Gordonia sp. (in: high G+C Gram-positive bacteria)]HRC49688.1 4-oxalocrotonate decarboxylase [Gordonia sp. (in: high G+C Gram-positive bacteria)]
MTTETWNAARVADTLLSCERGRTPRTSIAAEWPGLDLHTAYIAQDIALADRRSNGEVVTGVKLGLTSRAKQQQMGVDEPSVAWLTDAMVLPAGLPVPADRLIHPRAEPEIAFVMGRRLAGPGVTAATALAAVDVILGAIEIIDSRYSGFKFTLADAVADNNSSGVYVTGGIARRAADVDLPLEACLLEIDGHVVDSATGSAVLGNPAEALAFAANTLAARGHAIEAGWIVLTGGMTDAVAVERGARVAAHFTTLGSITLAGG